MQKIGNVETGTKNILSLQKFHIVKTKTVNSSDYSLGGQKMKRLLILFVFVLSIMIGHSQNVYYGYPRDNVQLNSGDLILLNIPAHRDWYFLPDGGISELADFLSRDTTHFFTIKLYYFWGSLEFRNDYVKFIGKCLNDYLLMENVPLNYEINCDNKDVILSNQDSVYYRMANTRMEIYVK